MRKRLFLLLAGAAAIVATLAVGPAATAGPEKASAGTVVFIHDQEPPSLRPNWVDNTLYATSLVTNNIFHGGMIRDNNANWVLRNFASKPKLVKRSPMTVTFTRRRCGATGVPSPATTGAWVAGSFSPTLPTTSPPGPGGKT
jgi:hypothetical protein